MKLNLEDRAVAVMADYDEETTGNQALDNLINAAMSAKDEMAGLRAQLATARADALEEAAGHCDILAAGQINDYRLWTRGIAERERRRPSRHPAPIRHGRWRIVEVARWPVEVLA